MKKIPHTHRYQLTAKGRQIITALLAACHVDVEQLTKLAA
jgi:DNA-binding HxlR family transcriptional regulator